MKIVKYLIPLFFVFAGCDSSKDGDFDEEEPNLLREEYGFVLSDFNVIRDTIRPGDTFGGILDANGVPQNKIFEVANKFRDSFDVRKIISGRPYVLLNSKDSLNTTQIFIYEKSRVNYAVVDLRDSINCYSGNKPVTFVQREASGIITNSLSQTMEEQNLSPHMTDRLADIYAWTVNFFHLQPGDRFKVIYTEKFINDTISAGLHSIDASYFEHRGRPLYAFHYRPETNTELFDFYDEEAENLRRAFLRSPIKFNYRISSRYNLKRRIKYYGFKLRPHKGTDFAAPVGTPILATADGLVTKSERRGGNGNYVKIKHNGTYETQYLHMKKRKVKKGDFVRQGDVIGWVGMTGNTGGPHVCYRFWKNGKQVDPFKQDLPKSKPLPAEFHEDYFAFMAPFKEKLDCISY